jgi:uncharacterized membrane protein YgdD (TMEM256/DUF423 family)|tara:strand:- start:8511 stop:8747 length:237 start_codon:yes stop_codon:yes gene_type:complete
LYDTFFGFDLDWYIRFYCSKNIFQIPAQLIFFGIIIFSSILYFPVLSEYKWLGPITPVGIAKFITGWEVLAVKLLRLS